MYIPLLSVARGHPPPHCENTQVLREAITEDDDDDEKIENIRNAESLPVTSGPLSSSLSQTYDKGLM